MAKPKTIESIERVTLKLPKKVAEYFRKAFPHGQRSDFVAKCILEHKREQEVKTIENELRDIGNERN